MKLSDELTKLNRYPFHMPGHKRNSAFGITGSNIDITEIDGFDNLHCADGMLADMEYALSEIYNYSRSIISVNGSTCGILSAISAVCNRGDKIIIARNCHKSVFNACYINELDTVYIEPEYNYEFGTYGRITQNTVNKAISENPDACAIVITSPSYEGFVSNIKTDIPIIIDAAHGAHFGMSSFLPKRQEGDIIIQSLHKTLPALTQTAVVHINNEKYQENVKKYMDIFETSSPSYILMASIDKCIDFLKNSKNAFDNFEKMLESFRGEAKKLKTITLLENDDKSRIVLKSNAISGIEFADILRNKYNIEIEAATLNYVILISTVCDTEIGFNMLIDALKEIDCISGKFIPFTKKPDIPPRAVKISETDKGIETNFKDSIGKTSAEYVFAYPPGVPLIVPGEIITQDIADSIITQIEAGINILSDSNLLPNSILVY